MTSFVLEGRHTVPVWWLLLQLAAIHQYSHYTVVTCTMRTAEAGDWDQAMYMYIHTLVNFCRKLRCILLIFCRPPAKYSACLRWLEQAEGGSHSLIKLMTLPTNNIMSQWTVLSTSTCDVTHFSITLYSVVKNYCYCRHQPSSHWTWVRHVHIYRLFNCPDSLGTCRCLCHHLTCSQNAKCPAFLAKQTKSGWIALGKTSNRMWKYARVYICRWNTALLL